MQTELNNSLQVLQIAGITLNATYREFPLLYPQPLKTAPKNHSSRFEADPILFQWKGFNMTALRAVKQSFVGRTTDNSLSQLLESSSLTISPLAWILGRKPSLKLIEQARATESLDYISERILARLAQAQTHEQNVWLREDIAYAFTIVSFAGRGDLSPVQSACRLIFRCQPEQVWQNVMATRRLKLGPEFRTWFDQAGNLKPDVPKKSSLPQSSKKERTA